MLDNEYTQRRTPMKKHIIPVIALMAATLLGGSLSARAFEGAIDDCDGPRAEHKMNPQKRIDRMAKELKLSAAQKEQVGAIMKAEQEQTEPLRRKMAAGHTQIQAVVNATAYDESAVRAIAAEQATIRTELLVLRTRAMHQVNALLTPEQRTQAQRLRDSRPGRHGHKKQMQSEG